MLGQKHDDTLRLMSRKVVDDDVNFLVGRLGGHHVGQKGDKLRAGVTGGRLSHHLAWAGHREVMRRSLSRHQPAREA